MFARTARQLSVLLLLATAASAQDITGSLEGRVLAPDGQPLVSVIVTASGPSLQAPRGVLTGSQGFFTIPYLPVGTYTVRVEHIGYRTVVYQSVSIRLGRITGLGETRLEVEAVELGELVVTVERPLIDVASTDVAANLPFETFETVPTERDFRSITVLAPLANLSELPADEVNISGSSGPESVYYVDGVNITDPIKQLDVVSGTGMRTELPYNFVREVEVKQGGYEAEYGRGMGGIVNAITQTGGNRFHGQVFGFFTNKTLTATPKFALRGQQEAGFSDYDFGGSLGGPIVKDRLWFYAAYNPQFSRQNVEFPGLNPLTDSRTAHLFAGKLTWQARPSTDVIVTGIGNPSVRKGIDPDFNLPVDSVGNEEGVLFEERLKGYVLSTEVRQRIGNMTELGLSVSYTTRTQDVGPQDATLLAVPRYVDFVEGYVEDSFGGEFHTRGTRMAGRLNLTTAIGSHTLKVGGEFEQNAFEDRGQGNFVVRFAPDFYVSLPRTQIEKATWYNRIPTFYAQDSWRATPRLTLNYGLRWEGQYITDSDGALAQKFTDQWQPRLGIVFQPGEPGSQRVVGSYGRFYQQLALNLGRAFYSRREPRLAITYDHDPRFDPSGGDTVSFFAARAQPMADLRGQYHDEFTLGYERTLWRDYRIGVRGIYRKIGWVVEDALDVEMGDFVLGNPGRGELSFAQRARREYAALILSFERPAGSRFDFGTSYVLSRNYGNYDGLYSYFALAPQGHFTFTFDEQVDVENTTGLLTNNRTHTLKVYGTYRFAPWLSAGTFLFWSSGTPRNEFGTTENFGRIFLVPRGTAGRTPSVFDANLRFMVGLPNWGGKVEPRLQLDIFHIGNRREAIQFEEQRFLFVDENGDQAGENPNFGRAIHFRPPMSVRLGLIVDF